MEVAIWACQSFLQSILPDPLIRASIHSEKFAYLEPPFSVLSFRLREVLQYSQDPFFVPKESIFYNPRNSQR